MKKNKAITLVSILMMIGSGAHAQFGITVVSVSSPQREHDGSEKLTNDTNTTDTKNLQLSPVVGVLTFPFKYRPQTGVFEKTFSLNVVGGIDRRLGLAGSKHSIKILAGAGGSSVTIKPRDMESGMLTDDDEAGAITFSFSAIYSWDFLQVGVSSGRDYLFDNDNRWRYHGRGWLSFGIGVSLFKKADD